MTPTPCGLPSSTTFGDFWELAVVVVLSGCAVVLLVEAIDSTIAWWRGR